MKSIIKYNKWKFWLSSLLLLSIIGNESHAGKRKPKPEQEPSSNYSAHKSNTSCTPKAPKVPRNFRIFNAEEAQKIFDDIQNIKTIPFAYFREGCFARAHEVSDRLRQVGIESKKVWVFSELNTIQPKKYPTARWSHHVAPVIPVRDKDGEVKWKVIDPTLLSTISTVEQWLGEMNLSLEEEVVYSTRSEYLRSDLAFGASCDEEESDLQIARAVNERHLELLLTGRDCEIETSGAYFFF
ncbi:MAG: protein-glutamine glutaminase family protein [Bdellovibrionia bacterium]